VVVLESLEHAQGRSAPILGEIVGFGMSSDAGDLTSPDASGMVRAIEAALADAGLSPEDIQYVNAHGTGTAANDEVETNAIKRAFGRHAEKLALSSNKSMLGHALGAAGALELVATLMSMKDEIVPPTINYLGPDPACDLDCVPNEARRMRVQAALSNSFAFGGLNAVLAVRGAENQKRPGLAPGPCNAVERAKDQKSMPPIPPPPPGGMAGGCFFGTSATIASVVISSAATEAAPCRA
jgi:nodulation protein E